MSYNYKIQLMEMFEEPTKAAGILLAVYVNIARLCAKSGAVKISKVIEGAANADVWNVYAAIDLLDDLRYITIIDIEGARSQDRIIVLRPAGEVTLA